MNSPIAPHERPPIENVKMSSPNDVRYNLWFSTVSYASALHIATIVLGIHDPTLPFPSFACHVVLIATSKKVDFPILDLIMRLYLYE